MLIIFVLAHVTHFHIPKNSYVASAPFFTSLQRLRQPSKAEWKSFCCNRTSTDTTNSKVCALRMSTNYTANTDTPSERRDKKKSCLPNIFVFRLSSLIMSICRVNKLITSVEIEHSVDVRFPCNLHRAHSFCVCVCLFCGNYLVGGCGLRGKTYNKKSP